MELSFLQLLPRDVLHSELVPILRHVDANSVLRERMEASQRELATKKGVIGVLLLLGSAILVTMITFIILYLDKKSEVDVWPSGLMLSVLPCNATDGWWVDGVEDISDYALKHGWGGEWPNYYMMTHTAKQTLASIAYSGNWTQNYNYSLYPQWNYDNKTGNNTLDRMQGCIMIIYNTGW